MSKISDKILGYMATTAEEAFLEAMGLASLGGAYEPKLSDEIKAYKSSRISKIETIFDKLVK